MIPHSVTVYDVAVLASLLTLLAFRRYTVGFGARCLFTALAVVAAGQSSGVAAERLANVALGGLIGALCVLAAHLLRGRPNRGDVGPHRPGMLDWSARNRPREEPAMPDAEPRR